jgi:hypothetical protein
MNQHETNEPQPLSAEYLAEIRDQAAYAAHCIEGQKWPPTTQMGIDAVNAVPALLAEVDRLRAQLAATQATAEALPLSDEALIAALGEEEPGTDRHYDLVMEVASRGLHEEARRGQEGGNAEQWVLNVDPCQADQDGYCVWGGCPQLRDGEPSSSGRHCPMDSLDDDDK